MWSIICLSSFILCATCSSIRNDCVYPDRMGNEADYYWRDYHGRIPKDAVPGGYDELGNVTYIGQLAASTQHPGIYPGTLYPGQKAAVMVMKKKMVDDTYVKVLCSNPENKFEWKKTSADKGHLLTDFQFVIGGSEGKLVSYIGRANFEGQVQVGRVYFIPQYGKGLWLLNKEGTETNLLTFELLVLPR